jgi:hypothetical protein
MVVRYNKWRVLLSTVGDRLTAQDHKCLEDLHVSMTVPRYQLTLDELNLHLCTLSMHKTKQQVIIVRHICLVCQIESLHRL